ncbi:MAG: hypothetical protein HC824_04825 [Synechococcales cyanobacterium RM1_1_8]|nr:hypothetical protein [Synechococcales cyanobacterium RM1_1_8]
MNQDISYWLAEVQSLQQQLNVMREERDEANHAAAQWRDRYQAETQIRQRNTALLQSQIRELEAAQTAGQREGSPNEIATSPEILEILADLSSLEELQDYVQEVARERDRLRRALETERQAHGVTRQELSLALGDTIDLLTQRTQAGA